MAFTHYVNTEVFFLIMRVYMVGMKNLNYFEFTQRYTHDSVYKKYITELR